MTEDDVRRIVREEIAAVLRLCSYGMNAGLEPPQPEPSSNADRPAPEFAARTRFDTSTINR